MKCIKIWFQLGTKPMCVLECLHTVLEYVKTVRKEGLYFENKVLMKLRLKKKKVIICNYAMVAILLIAVNIWMNSGHLPHNSCAHTAISWFFCENCVLEDLPEEIC